MAGELGKGRIVLNLGKEFRLLFFFNFNNSYLTKHVVILTCNQYKSIDK